MGQKVDQVIFAEQAGGLEVSLRDRFEWGNVSDIVACFYRNLFILSPWLLELVPHRSSVVVLLPEDAEVPGVVGKHILHLSHDGVLSRAWRVREIPQNHDCQHHIPH